MAYSGEFIFGTSVIKVGFRAVGMVPEFNHDNMGEVTS